MIVGDDGLFKFGIVLSILRICDHRLGRQSVAKRILVRTTLFLFRARTGALAAIPTVRQNLLFCRHQQLDTVTLSSLTGSCIDDSFGCLCSHSPLAISSASISRSSHQAASLPV